MKITKANLLERIEALENENKQRGIGNQFMTLKCIQGNRHFTKDATYCASKLFDRTVITTNFGSRKELTVNTNIFGGYKATGENQTAVFQVIGADVEPEPQLKQLDQSVFDGIDKKWRFAAVDQNAETNLFEEKPVISSCGNYWVNASGAFKRSVLHFDNSNWQNSLIERENKELLEVDLSSQLTGSELCKAMLERGDRFVMCMAGDGTDVIYDLACFVSSTHPYIGRLDNYRAVTPINNQGEPLTASEVGL